MRQNEARQMDKIVHDRTTCQPLKKLKMSSKSVFSLSAYNMGADESSPICTSPCAVQPARMRSSLEYLFKTLEGSKVQ